MSLKNEFRHAAFLLQQGGFRGVWEHVRENVLFDLRHGTNTSQWLAKNDFKFVPNLEHGVRYRASYQSEIERGIKIASEFLLKSSFYDLGCGKGKALAIAGMSGYFNHIIGVEYYEPFVHIANDNMSKVGVLADIVNQDASQFEDYNDVAVIWMYNPFDEYIVRQVRGNIERQCGQAIVIYNKPVHADLFTGWRLLDQKTNDNEDRCTNIYSIGL